MDSEHMLVGQQFSQTQNKTHTFPTATIGKSLQKPHEKNKAESLTANWEWLGVYWERGRDQGEEKYGRFNDLMRMAPIGHS